MRVLEGHEKRSPDIGRCYSSRTTPRTVTATLTLIDSLDYDAYWHISHYFNVDNFFRNKENLFSSYHPEANLLCFHRTVPGHNLTIDKRGGIDKFWAWQDCRLVDSGFTSSRHAAWQPSSTDVFQRRRLRRVHRVDGGLVP